MHALRQFHKVQNGKLILHLPEDFNADEVEVIILPKMPDDANINQEDDSIQKAIQLFLSMDVSQFTPAQRVAFERTRERLQDGFHLGRERFWGLYQGLAVPPSDFDEFSEAEIELFYADNIFPSQSDIEQPE